MGESISLQVNPLPTPFRSKQYKPDATDSMGYGKPANTLDKSGVTD
jgi:hypothetical protein